MKTSELTGAALDWAVAKCEGTENTWGRSKLKPYEIYRGHSYSSDWTQGGPIIEREAVSLTQFNDYPQWTAKHPQHSVCYDGPAPLIAAMRCYVASKLGDDVTLPSELEQTA
jgi:hypothetical protein